MAFDCLIIGAGHSGILLARKLQQKSFKVCVLERDEIIGDVWRRRPDNMLLLTTRQLNSLPGLQFLGNKHSYISQFEFAEYLGFYVAHYGIDVKTECEVVKITREADDYVVETKAGERYQAKCVVNATGVYQKPKCSPLMSKLAEDVAQWTLDEYKNPAQLANKKHVAVIGDGMSGRQIAQTFAVSGLKVTLFCGGKKTVLPNKLFGRSIFGWLDKLGILSADVNGGIGRWWNKKHIIPTIALKNKRLKAQGIQLAASLVNAEGNQLTDSKDKCYQVDAVVWCIGFEDETQWCSLPDTIDEHGFVCQTGHKQGGKTAQTGFFMLSRQGLTCGASEWIMGANRDTEQILALIEQHLAQR